MHLVSQQAYPKMHMMPIETAVEYLTSAPRVCQSKPVLWTFLEAPVDGTVMLTWLPLAHMASQFATDGYVWADNEQVFSFELRGFVRVPFVPFGDFSE